MAKLPSYRPSGRVSIVFFGLALVAIAVVAAIAWLYQLLITWVPYIYVNFLIYLGMIGVVAAAAWIVSHRGKSRNRWLGTLAGGLIGLAAVGASHYVAYDRLLDEAVEQIAKANEVSEAEVQAVVEKELTFGRYVDLRLEAGWSLGSRSADGSGDITGVMVWIIWGIEALGLFATGAIVGGIQPPFCERCQRWTKEHELTTRHDVPGTELAAIAAAPTVEALLTIPPEAPADASPFRVSYATDECPDCSGEVYLNVWKKWETPGKEGPEGKSELLQRQVAVSREQVRKLGVDVGRIPRRPGEQRSVGDA